MFCCNCIGNRVHVLHKCIAHHVRVLRSAYGITITIYCPATPPPTLTPHHTVRITTCSSCPCSTSKQHKSTRHPGKPAKVATKKHHHTSSVQHDRSIQRCPPGHQPPPKIDIEPVRSKSNGTPFVKHLGQQRHCTYYLLFVISRMARESVANLDPAGSLELSPAD